VTSYQRPDLDQRPVEPNAQPISARRLAVMAIFIALAAVGSLIKIPSPVGTIGLDSAPGFFVAIGFAGWMGAVVAAVGHLITAAVVGFPLSLPVHLVLAVGMAACAFVFGWLGRKGTVGLIAGFVLAALLNSVVLGLIMLPIGGVVAYTATIIPLLIGATMNLAIATVAYLALRNTRLLD